MEPSPTASGSEKTRYFGRALPPACALRGCYFTDDGERFYCKDLACDKHRSRRSKHSRYGRHDHLNPDRATSGTRAPAVPVRLGPHAPEYTRCPWCVSPRIAHRLLENDYACENCARTWT